MPVCRRQAALSGYEASAAGEAGISSTGVVADIKMARSKYLIFDLPPTIAASFSRRAGREARLPLFRSLCHS